MYYKELESGVPVRFQLSKAVCPEFCQLLENITDRLDVTGRVVYLSDAGEKKDFYAVVEVCGIETPLIVPVDQLLRSEVGLPSGAVIPVTDG
jgi:hypothetical protein